MLVVGGAGYIGSHAARLLRKEGFDVVIYDNLSTGYASLVHGFELVQGDIADSERLSGVMRRVTAVMHFAAHAYVGESVENPRKYFRNNVECGLLLLNAAIDAGVGHFISSSTCAVYGLPNTVPIPESTTRQPVNPYGVSKLFFEQALESYGRAYGLRFASLRYFNAAGADEGGETGECHIPETHLIPLALQAAAGTGDKLQIFGGDYAGLETLPHSWPITVTRRSFSSGGRPGPCTKSFQPPGTGCGIVKLRLVSVPLRKDLRQN